MTSVNLTAPSYFITYFTVYNHITTASLLCSVVNVDEIVFYKTTQLFYVPLY